MSDPKSSPPSEESHAFVVRMRLDPPPAPDIRHGLRPPAETASGTQRRLIIRVEHVNSTDVTSHQTVEAALSWLRTRMGQLLGSARQNDDPPSAPARH
jgi:hypothetical protein